MASEKQSLTNYEAILWLWNATDAERMMFLASLKPEQRSQFCDVLKDVLNNPLEGRSAIKLTKLNKLLGQNVDRIKKQVQFSGDRTPDLDEKQIFRLLHDYTVLSHDGVLKLTSLGRQNLEKLLVAVNGEFVAYYNRDASHPQLMWDGFQNDTQFPNEGMEKTQVEPTSYDELNDKIANYYFPVGGGPKPKPQDEDDYDHQEDYRGGEDDDTPSESLKVMHLRYLPVFLAYALFAVHVGFFGVDTPWTVLFGFIVLFSTVKWYNVFKFYDRGWASLLQGFWVLNYPLSLVLALGGIYPLIFTLAWPLVAFWFLARKLHCHTSGQKKFITIWTVVLGVMGLVSGFSFSHMQHATREHRRNAITRQPVVDVRTAQNHIARMRSQEGGIRWDGLISSDLQFLTPEEVETLRLQLTNVMKIHDETMEALTLGNMRPSRIGGYFNVEMSLNQPIYVVVSEKSGLSGLLGTGEISYIDVDVLPRNNFACDLLVTANDFLIDRSAAYTNKRCGGALLLEWRLREGLSRKNHAYIQIGSQAERDIGMLAKITRKITGQIKADELIARADIDAQVRLDTNNQKLRYLRKLVAQLRSAGQIITALPEELKRIVDSDDWHGMYAVDKDDNRSRRSVVQPVRVPVSREVGNRSNRPGRTFRRPQRSGR